MRIKPLFTALLACLLIAGAPRAVCADTDAPKPSAASKDLEALLERVQEKLKAGKSTEAEFADDIGAFDALLLKYKSEKTQDVAEILLMKASLYIEVLEDYEKGLALINALKADFPETKLAGELDQLIEDTTMRADLVKKRRELVGKPAPAMEFQWASREKLKSLAELKGKVVVLDFWATWCGPCVESFPELRELVEHYKGFDVEILGVTRIQGVVVGLDPGQIDCRGNPAKEIGLMPRYVKAKNVTWSVAVCKEKDFDPSYGIYTIPHMVIVAADGTVRNGGFFPPRVPLEEKYKMIDALLKEAGLKTPGR